MSSSQTGEPRKSASRVIKSGTDVGERFAFPRLEQVTSRDLPPSLSAVPADPTRPEPATQAAALRNEAAMEAEARARAMERRAAHVLAEAEEAAARRVAEAEEAAKALLAEAEAGAEQIRTGARQAGLAEGRAEGHARGLEAGRAEGDAVAAAARRESDAILAEAQTAAVSIREGALEERARLLESTKEQILELAFAMARQILRAELTLMPAAVLPMLEAALIKLKGEEEPQVRVSPEIQQLLEEHRGRLLSALPGARKISVDGDPALEPGDYMVQGAQGFIDGRLDRQMDVLQAEVKEEER